MLRDRDRLEPSQGLREYPTHGPRVTCPCGPEKIQVVRLQNTKILEKIARCARTRDGQSDLQSRGSAADNGEGEDPAKMTYSRTDFLDRDGAKR